ncbi:ABC transporter substrate-binding protein [Gordoniibacillus kamchatkensis]|nr:sugar ABC transporter substrate-binding protein [Paenibacillus sp. VKM B-2647]
MMKSGFARMTGVVSVAAVLLSGCTGAGGNEKQGASAGNAGQKVTLKAIMEQVPDSDIVKKMVADFNKENPNIDVNIEMLPYDQIRDKIVTSFLAPSATYDLIVVDNPWMNDFASAGYLEPLEERVKAAGADYNYQDFSAPLRGIGEVNGHTYGIPFYNYALGLIYRKDLFEKQGLKPPSTLAELRQDAKLLTTGDQAGLAMQPQRGYKIFEEWANWLYAAGGAIQDNAGKITLNSPQAREALTQYIQTYKESAPKDSLNWGFDEALRAVSGGKAAMMLSYNWMLPALNDKGGQAGDLAGKFGLAEVPGGKSVLGAWYWSIPANTKNKEQVWSFIKWITSPQHEKQRVIAGGAPVRNSAMDDSEVQQKGFGVEYYKTVKAILKNAAPLGNSLNAEEMVQTVGTELSQAVSGQKSVDQAIADADKEAKDIINAKK